MPADVHQLLIPGQDDNFRHLHVIVIEIDSRQCLCVPAYDAAGEKVGRLTAALHRSGIYEGVGWVEIDNAVEVRFIGNWTGKLAKWVPYKISRVERRILRKPIGAMSDRGLGRIVECLLKLHAEQPASTLTDDELRKVKRLGTALGVTIPKGI